MPISHVNGIAVTTGSTINGLSGLSHINGIALATDGGGSPTDWVTSHTGGSIVAEAGGRGTKFTVGASGITATHLGIYVLSTSYLASMTVHLRNAAGASLGSVSISMASPDNTMRYEALSSPIALSAATSYFLTISEAGSNDFYSSRDLTTTPAATAVGQYYGSEGWETEGIAGAESFGPMSFRYT